jgi:hypothetical protein
MAERLDEEAQAVAINPGMLRDEFVAFPAQLAYYGERYSLAIARAAALEEQREDIEAEVYLELRANKADGQTEKVLASMVRMDKRVKLARDMALEAEANKQRFKHKVMDPLYAKKDMLVSIGAHQRAELSGDPMVKHARRDAVAELEDKLFAGR